MFPFFPMIFIQEPSLDASYRTSGPEDYRDSQTSGTADSLHSNGNNSRPAHPLPTRTPHAEEGLWDPASPPCVLTLVSYRQADG